MYFMWAMTARVDLIPATTPYLPEKLRCPVCGARVIDARRGIKTRLYDLENHPDSVPDYYTKCAGCRRIIGIEKQ
jgi:uncharacterized protein with PIN domain